MPGHRRGETDVGVVVDESEGVGSHDTHAVRPGTVQQRGLAGLPFGTGLGEAGGDHHEGLHAGLGAVVHDVQHPLGGHGDDRHVHAALDVGDPGVRGQSPHRVGLAVDEVDLTGEPAVEEVVEQDRSHGVRPAAGTDDGHRARAEQRVHALRLGAMLAGELDGLALLGGLDRELHGDHAVVEPVLDLIACVDEDVHHLAVLGQDVGHEATDPPLLRDRRQVLQEDRPHPLPW
ncbi:hypothetical protein GCM10025883_18140 [Mobilicoccus caccae]|uniref:Uncharacterized protein n=1 Tax=Mobilicoccus caccae TaxID=1859295 RepID=A0ABQ6IQP0_9MICO|nr:hypothetical protein GCM10025883_18140 [Mobilicoccus caccae]